MRALRRVSILLLSFLLGGYIVSASYQEPVPKRRVPCFQGEEKKREEAFAVNEYRYKEEEGRLGKERASLLDETKKLPNLIDRAKASIAIRSKYRESLLYITKERDAMNESIEKGFLEGITTCTTRFP